jgi:hypothetical protein
MMILSSPVKRYRRDPDEPTGRNESGGRSRLGQDAFGGPGKKTVQAHLLP